MRQLFTRNSCAVIADGDQRIASLRESRQACLECSAHRVEYIEVSMRQWPPCSIASRALAARFIRTCSICIGSTRTRPNAGPGEKLNSMSSPMSRGRVLAIPADNLVQFHDAQRLRLLSAEGQKLTRQFGSASRRQQDFLNLGFQRAILRHIVEREFGVAGDDGQQIVEVVSDAAGQVGRLHPFSAPASSCASSRKPVCEIAAIRNEMRNLAIRVAHRADALFDVVEFTVLLAVHKYPAKNVPGEDRVPHLLIGLDRLLSRFENAGSSARKPPRD